MASVGVAARIRWVVPAPLALFGFLIVGTLAVLGLPGLADVLPRPDSLEGAQYAATCAGVVALSGAYLYIVARMQNTLDRKWISWTLAYAAGLAIVKFILSPDAFEKASGTSLNSFVVAGMAMLPLYVGTLVVIYRIARSKANGWSIGSKLSVAAGLAAFAVTMRLVVALVFGTASEYVRSLAGPGLFLPLIAVLASIAVMQSFDRAEPSLTAALRTSVALVVAQHLLWPVYMYGLFS